MKSIGEFHESDAEELHIQLMKVHGDVAWGAARRIERALEVLHKLERKSMDIRPEIHERIKKFESLRSDIEALWMKASSLRTELQRADGCTGACNGQAQRSA